MIKDNVLHIYVTENNANKIIKKTRYYKSYCDKKGYMIKFNTQLSNQNLIDIETAINLKNKFERYNFIYDRICFYLDERIKTNYCEFKDDICIKYRLKGLNHKNGCCECKGRGKCKYLIDGQCTMKSCMACKLFTCKTLKKMGIKQNINDYPLAKYFFDSKEKYILSYSFWTPKEIVMERLMTKKYIKP